MRERAGLGAGRAGDAAGRGGARHRGRPAAPSPGVTVAVHCRVASWGETYSRLGGRLPIPPAATRLQSRWASLHHSTRRVAKCGPRGRKPISVAGTGGRLGPPARGNHLSGSALPTRWARRKSRPGPRAPPAPAAPWPPDLVGPAPPLPPPPSPPVTSSAAGGHRRALRGASARGGPGGDRKALKCRREAPAYQLQMAGSVPIRGLFQEADGSVARAGCLPEAAAQPSRCFPDGGRPSSKAPDTLTSAHA